MTLSIRVRDNPEALTNWVWTLPFWPVTLKGLTMGFIHKLEAVTVEERIKDAKDITKAAKEVVAFLKQYMCTMMEGLVVLEH
ncbi:hypothetical protein VNO80_14395 [Phaseolus coccineus]|uniref:Uncharacterized protein n=1 Tax=Phaseolus coccineus TaxID=3886 RepID=A0AAN9MPG0_PHACN